MIIMECNSRLDYDGSDAIVLFNDHEHYYESIWCMLMNEHDMHAKICSE